MAAVDVTPVKSDSDLLEFISLPWQVFRGNPYWVPPLLSERKAFLDRQRSPFFQHAKAEYFLARRGGKVVGTIAAFTNELYNQFQQVNTGFLGFFEVLEDPEAAGRCWRRPRTGPGERGTPPSWGRRSSRPTTRSGC